MEKIITNLLIIGSGPAGYTAAIYAARANVNPILFQGIQPGGQLTITTEVENYPGFPNGVQGPELMEYFEKQAINMGATCRYGMIDKVDFSSQPYKAWVADEVYIEARSIIISTGASAKWLGIPSETKYNGYGVSACAVCDGFFFKGQEVAIVGAGDTAAEEALYLSKLCTKVHLLIRKDKMRASKIMQDRLFKTDNIKIYWNTETDEILGEKKVNGVRIYNTISKEKTIIPISGFFVAIGHQPNSSLFKGFIDMDENGYINTKPGTTQTNLPGIFAAGDIQDTHYRQAITAAGTGCMAALEAERYLSANEFI
ncbi:MAG: thioredoxin-disulfide reductase [Sediminibacterium sp.]|nr:thioredoxin-disulfide reductase [Sediminibacterium sp.]